MSYKENVMKHDFRSCPNCSSSECFANSKPFKQASEKVTCRIKMKCHQCYSEWDEVYHLATYDNLTPPAPTFETLEVGHKFCFKKRPVQILMKVSHNKYYSFREKNLFTASSLICQEEVKDLGGVV